MEDDRNAGENVISGNGFLKLNFVEKARILMYNMLQKKRKTVKRRVDKYMNLQRTLVGENE